MVLECKHLTGIGRKNYLTGASCDVCRRAIDAGGNSYTIQEKGKLTRTLCSNKECYRVDTGIVNGDTR